MTTKKTIQTVRGLEFYTRHHPKLKKLLDKDAPEIHGDKIWFSSYFLMDYLDEHPPVGKNTMMEIGCGWGPLGIYCAKTFGSKVIAVDADKCVFPFLELQASLNGVKIKQKVARYENLKPELLAKQDLIAGGDICFWDELVEPLYTLIKNALDAGVKRILIADPGRPPFLKLARRCKKLHGAKLKTVETSKPRSYTGYLLILEQPDV